jgi:hypothetical protein
VNERTGEPQAAAASVAFHQGRDLARLGAERDQAVASAVAAEQVALSQLVEDLAEAFDPTDLPETLAGATATVAAHVRDLRRRAARAERERDDIRTRVRALYGELSAYPRTPIPAGV